MRITTTPFLIAIATVSTASVMAAIPNVDWVSTAAMSLSAGVAALAMMGMAALLGARWRWVESLFGGLDRVYEVHKWLGVWALVLASVHLVFKAGAPDWETASILSLPPFWTRLVRQLSYVALVLIVMLALNRKIPYGTWRWWHKLSGPLFLIVVMHWLSFKSPIALASPAGLWLAICAALGVAGAIWKLLLYPFFSRHAEYRITSVRPGPSSVRLELMPVGRGIAFDAGQFGFLRLLHPGLREPHPFTLASAGAADQPVQFVIRALGDFTGKLVAEAAPGMHAEVYAPYGRFRRNAAAGDAEVWIAGGVGLSPFIAWLQDDKVEGPNRVTLFNFYTPGREFPGMDELGALARQRGVDWVQVAGGADAPEFRERLERLVGEVGGSKITI
ncbi:MAG TPA: ferric reductase-like transmembrane domain-containing protein, partial [Patescibacteria group bacterium]|nr:ferric reductase-like transmembrane domain-containing protein [Patescibacteria group bacterium]